MKYTKTSTIWLILLYAAMILFACIMESCRSERVITVPEYHTLVAHQHDTLIQRDTVEREKRTIVRQLDSTAMADYGIRRENAERAWLVQTDALRREVSQLRKHQTDTVVVHDSIPYLVEVPVIKEVEKPPNWWQRLSMRVGSAVLLLLALSLSGGFLYLLLRHRFRL